jgi:hypothetical protein
MAPEYSKSASTSETLSRRDLLVLAAVVVLGAAIYLISSALTYGIGFPLDDSWIHQTYARNLALQAEWSFRPGETSAGSTAPLWSALLAFGYWLRLAPYAWTYLLGALSLWSLALVGERTARRLIPSYRPGLPWVGLVLAFEWRLIWAAMSGMETLFHALILTIVLTSLMTGSRRYLALGLLTGLSVWVRPDGLTLLGPVALTILLDGGDLRSRVRSLTIYLIGFGSLFLLYLLFNLVVGGTPMPNTFYAKQAEYAAWQVRPGLERVGEMSLQLLVGPLLFLLPGVIGWVVVAIRRRDWGSLTGLVWSIGYLWLYVSRLPVYQHGRYIMPVLPLLTLFGLLGLVQFSKLSSTLRYQPLARLAWQAGVTFMALGFFILGAKSYSEDVAVIESEMVVSARWAAENIPSDALIAAHDIGALGYFDDHRILDLAGLVSPEVVPFIRDESRLAAFLDQRGAQYLIAFPEFYPHLVQAAEPVFSTEGGFAPDFGGENMVIYRWKRP